MGKTLKQFSYKGCNVYIRYIYSRYYELLVAYKGGIYSHFVWVEKPHKTEKRITNEQRDEGAITELSTAAIVLIENLNREFGIIGRLKKIITKLNLWQQKMRKDLLGTNTQD